MNEHKTDLGENRNEDEARAPMADHVSPPQAAAPFQVVERYNGLLTTCVPDDALQLAISRARAEFPHIEKNAKADLKTYWFKYADLAAIFAATTPALSKYGLNLSQPILDDGTRKILVTRITHGDTGQFIECARVLPKAKSSKDAAGDETYWRRYSLNTMLGIHPADDVDCLYESNDPATFSESRPRRRGEPAANATDAAPVTPAHVDAPPPVDGRPALSKNRFTRLLNELNIDPRQFDHWRKMIEKPARRDMTDFQRAAIGDRLKAGGTEASMIRAVIQGDRRNLGDVLNTARESLNDAYQAANVYVMDAKIPFGEEITAALKDVGNEPRRCDDLTKLFAAIDACLAFAGINEEPGAAAVPPMPANMHNGAVVDEDKARRQHAALLMEPLPAETYPGDPNEYGDR